MRRLALFARTPVAGSVKTRLTPALPARIALDLHRAMVEDALALLAGTAADARELWWSEPPAAGDVAAPPGFGVRIQSGGDLGARLEAAFARLLAGGARALVIGADCPSLAPDHLEAALAALDDHDAALIPAADGGYVAVALARPAPELFRGIAWGTERVLSGTLAAALRARRRVRVLEPLDDLDTPADLARHVARQVSARPVASPALDRALRATGLLPPA